MKKTLFCLECGPTGGYPPHRTRFFNNVVFQEKTLRRTEAFKFGLPWHAMACLGMPWHALACHWHTISCYVLAIFELGKHKNSNWKMLIVVPRRSKSSLGIKTGELKNAKTIVRIIVFICILLLWECLFTMPYCPKGGIITRSRYSKILRARPGQLRVEPFVRRYGSGITMTFPAWPWLHVL